MISSVLSQVAWIANYGLEFKTQVKHILKSQIVNFSLSPLHKVHIKSKIDMNIYICTHACKYIHIFTCAQTYGCIKSHRSYYIINVLFYSRFVFLFLFLRFYKCILDSFIIILEYLCIGL